MLKTKDILDEKNPILRKVSKPVKFPLNRKEKDLIDTMMEYVELSQIPEYAEKYDLRPGTGLSAVQLGELKRIFVVAHETEPETFDKFVLINPELVSHIEDLIYVPEGEGCLSVNRPTEGIVYRYETCVFKAQDINGKEFEIEVDGELSITFQHELDHLNGILFVDRIKTQSKGY